LAVFEGIYRGNIHKKQFRTRGSFYIGQHIIPEKTETILIISGLFFETGNFIFHP
jgi:hypothetical protein